MFNPPSDTKKNQMANQIEKTFGRKASVKVSGNVDASGLGGQYADAAAANPYGEYRDTRSLLQRIGDAFGITNYYASGLEEATQRSDEYLSQLHNQQREERYNSAPAQADRLAAAGTNAALAGVEPGQAAEGVEPERGPMSNAVPQTFDLGAAVQQAISVYSAMQGLHMQGLDIQAKDLSISSSLRDAAKKYVFDTLTAKDASGVDGWEAGSNKALARQSARAYANRYFTSRRFKRSFAQNVRMIANGLDTRKDVQKFLNDYENDRRDYLTNKAQPTYSGKDSEMIAALQPLLQYKYNVERLTAQYQDSKMAAKTNGYTDKDEFGQPLPAAQEGLNENAQIDADKELVKYQKEMAEARNKLYKSLMNSDNLFAQFLLLYLEPMMQGVGKAALGHM